jgi:hypothetical protein
MANGLLALLNDCGVAIVGGVVFGVVMLGVEMVGSVGR